MKRKKLEGDLRKMVINKEVSPIYYFMVLEDLTLSELAARVKIWKFIVKKHLDYKRFQSISKDVLEKYADVFNVSVSDMLHLMTPTTLE
jgi:hypothetical protein